MIEELIDEKEMTFLKELEKHENKWVAIVQIRGRRDNCG